MIGCKLVETFMDPNTKLGARNDGVVVDNERYQRLVEKLIYLTHTCLNVSFVVSLVSQFMNNPTKEHIEVVYKILR